ncbi:acetyl-CoA acetyltransferase [Gluconacetobacter liquefaciens]|uniref:Acetyl-CoA acyltransferase n=1 Tax=Gluconacetobacter liquefaciens TaxID=89584 RepID=A0A370GCT7_GLULI|nr:thiolase family protein [Gluconacetobacter liquefaciens]MBB2185975.1 thiolase family protein [Gluconacetobacter liquefaciens]RDI39793.1 acetyl-CoA acyltransferase [Gluconacetobacter liquefaciens]GBQ99924.1 beta-ketoadipyl CoA thiolase [Gluconacetobacter liquefaciens NRIC 0522]GEB37612.1 acetyl-CoA acetyltransferase [Gluconacetobacter liquefaciens]
MNSVVIAGYARSPFQLARKGQFVRTRPDDIAAQVVRGLVERTGVAPEDIEDLILGCAFPEGEQGFNLGRIVALLSDLPLSVGGVTVNRFCGSSMQSIHMAAGAIRMGAGEAFICAGVESMTRIPMGGFNPLPNPALYKKKPGAYMDMGITAENVARKYEISRDQQEQFALRSQARARDAIAAGRLEAEIVPIQTRDGVVSADGCPRPDTTAEGLAGLKPAFDAAEGTVTAGTSSPLTDGAASVLVCSEAYADRKGLPKLARIRSIAISGCEPEVMGLGPILSSRKAMERAGITIEDVGVVELNEAFASQSIACARELGVRDATLNIDGGAIALGHPLGATGARIVGKAAQLLEREGARYALATQCIGGGQGIATVLERI